MLVGFLYDHKSCVRTTERTCERACVRPKMHVKTHIKTGRTCEHA